MEPLKRIRTRFSKGTAGKPDSGIRRRYTDQDKEIPSGIGVWLAVAFFFMLGALITFSVYADSPYTEMPMQCKIMDSGNMPGWRLLDYAETGKVEKLIEKGKAKKKPFPVLRCKFINGTIDGKNAAKLGEETVTWLWYWRYKK